MNAHRTALRALAEQTAGEARREHGTEAINLGRIHATLTAAINAGDEAEAAEVEIVDDDTWNEDVRKGVEARMTLGALRRAVARALGRPTARRQILGPDVEVVPPADEVMLSEVELLARRAREFRSLREGLATALDVDVLADDRLLAILRERIGSPDVDGDKATDENTTRED